MNYATERELAGAVREFVATVNRIAAALEQQATNQAQQLELGERLAVVAEQQLEFARRVAEDL